MLVAVPAVGAQETEAAETSDSAALITRCADSTEGNVVGLEALEAQCPGLEHALVESGYSEFLSDAELKQLTTYGLVDLQQLDARYRQPIAAANGQASIDDLKSILESLQKRPQAEVPLTWFEKFKRWLRNLLDRREEPRQSWLDRWLKDVHVPEAMTKGITYGAIGLVIVLAIVVVINELRAAGVLRRARRRAGREQLDAAVMDEATSVANEAADDRDQAAALLKVLVAKLVKTGRLRSEKSLTHRELSKRAVFDAAEQRARFERLALLGETLLYGHTSIPREQIDAVVQAGRTLEQELSQTTAGTT